MLCARRPLAETSNVLSHLSRQIADMVSVKRLFMNWRATFGDSVELSA